MYNIMTMQQREGLESKKIMTIRLEVEDTEVTTFQKRQNWEGARTKTSIRPAYRTNSGNKNNQAITPTVMESTVFIANYNDSWKMNACAESDRTNHSRPNKAELIGQKCL